MKLKYSKNSGQSPSSAIGIMKFKDSISGLEITPEFIVVAIIVVALVVLFLKYFVF